MTELRDLQQMVQDIRKQRGFTMEPLQIYTLLNEEVGEVAGELKKTWSKNYPAFDKQKLSEEVADVLVCLIALANRFEIDLEKALVDKLVKKDGKRYWKSAETIREEE